MCGRDKAKVGFPFALQESERCCAPHRARHQGAWRASRRAESLFLSRNAPHRRRRFFKFFPARFLLALSNTGSSKGLKALLLLLSVFYLSGIHKAQPLIGAAACAPYPMHLWRKQSRKNYSRRERERETLIQCKGNKTPYFHSCARRAAFVRLP